MKFGLAASARAISTRRRSPPDSASADERRRWVSAKSAEQPLEQRVAPVALGLGDLQHGADIVLDVEAAEDRRFLRQVADPEPGATVHRQSGDVLVVQQHLPGVGGDQPGDDVEAGGLAGAIRPQQAHGLAPVDRQRDIAQHGAVAVVLAQMPRR